MTPAPLLLGSMVGAGAALVLLPGLSGSVRLSLVGNVRRAGLHATGRTVRHHSADLAIVGWNATDLVVRQLAGVTLGATGSALLASAYGGGLLALSLACAGGFLGFVLPPLRLRTRARSRRRTFVHAFSAYLDLVNVLLAGGAGIETALTAASDVGDGWAFGALRSCIARARLARRSPWTELRALGTRWGIDEVVEAAGSMTLSGDHGARIRTSLAARAESLRARQLAEVEALAQSSTERMGVPMMMLFVGFMALLGYPALQTVVMNM